MQDIYYAAQCWLYLHGQAGIVDALQTECPATEQDLTHWGRDKMAAIFQTTVSNAFSWMKTFVLWFNFHFKFVPKDPFINKTALVKVMAWRRSGDKPLLKPMLTQFTDAHMRH